MPRFVLTYHHPVGYTPSADSAGPWMAWFDSMGDQLVDIGQPVASAAALGNCGSGTELGGYSLISAPDLQAALAIAKGCPHLTGDGGVQVGELTAVPARAS
ncbi:MAG TPA: hypothetical protein VMI33_00460 [Streptosporangiaceae bacterium]|nr:hypothetical protein [Streptosporangiaceae bacterium]